MSQPRRACRWWISFIVLVLAGCSHQDFTGLGVGLRGSKTVSGQAAASDSQSRLQQALARWQAYRGPGPEEYRVGPGDVLEVSIFALESPEETTVLERTVDGEGNISLPWIGNTYVAGKTQREIEREVAERYGHGYLLNPQVAVNVKEYRSHAVVVTGAAAKPGVYFLRKEGTTLLEVLAMAGGLDSSAGERVMVMRSVPKSERGLSLRDGLRDTGKTAGGRLIAIDLARLLDGEDISANIEVRPGDVVLVPPREERFVYVLGYVQRPGAYPVGGADRVDAVRAVALAGGLTPTARAQNSFIVRTAEDGVQEVIPLDLVRMARGKDPPFYLEPGDTLVVGSGLLARLSEFIRPSVAAGVSYAPVP